MKKSLLITVCIFASFVHAMEETETISLLGITHNSLSLIYKGTKINLTKEPLLSAANKADYTIIGSHQQELLSGKFDTQTIGALSSEKGDFLYMSQNTPVYAGQSTSFYKKNDVDESTSDDDTYKPYPYESHDKKEKLWDSTYQETKSYFYNITEPCISTSPEGFVYNVWRKNPNYIPFFLGYDNHGVRGYLGEPDKEKILLQFSGDEAIQEASEDLSFCYREILRIIARYYMSTSDPEAQYHRPFSEENQDITISALSIDVGFPQDIATPIAIAAIFNFLQEYPEGYNNINLVVKKRSTFTLYKKLLMKYYKPIQAICLVYCAYTQKNGSFLDIPREIIDHIILFMFNG